MIELIPELGSLIAYSVAAIIIAWLPIIVSAGFARLIRQIFSEVKT